MKKEKNVFSTVQVFSWSVVFQLSLKRNGPIVMFNKQTSNSQKDWQFPLDVEFAFAQFWINFMKNFHFWLAKISLIFNFFRSLKLWGTSIDIVICCGKDFPFECFDCRKKLVAQRKNASFPLWISMILLKEIWWFCGADIITKIKENFQSTNWTKTAKISVIFPLFICNNLIRYGLKKWFSQWLGRVRPSGSHLY